MICKSINSRGHELILELNKKPRKKLDKFELIHELICINIKNLMRGESIQEAMNQFLN